jgi:hypothetical protein
MQRNLHHILLSDLTFSQHLRPNLASGRCLSLAALTLASLLDASTDLERADTPLLRMVHDELRSLTPPGSPHAELSALPEFLTATLDAPSATSKPKSCTDCENGTCPRSGSSRRTRRHLVEAVAT